MKKLLAIFLVAIFVFSAVACDKGKPIEIAEDLFGVWKVTQPLPDYFTEEYCGELGLTDFKTSAVYEWYIELHNDGTTTYLIDYEFNKQSREKSHYTCFYELFSEAKKTVPNDEFVSFVKSSHGYDNYQKLLDENTINEYIDSEHYEGYKEFLNIANAEMKKYADSAIEEQAAIGAMWGELLQDVGTRFVYKDDEWQPLSSVRYDWSFENGTFIYGGMKHELEGNTESFTMDGEFFKDSIWTCVK